jgi:acetyltransferase-like isoleucine patch superfamily enzyme
LLGAGTQVWQTAQVCEGVVVGTDCVIGRGAYLGPGVVLGDRCRIREHVVICEPAFLESEVLLGPAVVLTNGSFVRAVPPPGMASSAQDDSVGVHIGQGASIGARAVCVAPVSIGRWALVTAAAVVTDEVPDFALVAGVPARQVGWVGHAGVPLESTGRGGYRCPATGRTYMEWRGRLEERIETTPRPRRMSEN